MLVDSHCHLDFPQLFEDLDAVVGRAAAAGVGTMVTICTKVTEFDRVRAIAEAHDHIWCTVGIHPHEAGTEPAVTADDLLRLAAHPKVVGIGETGLDYYYEHSPREAQQASFRAHIEASRRSGLPLVVHTRDADDDTPRILEEEYAIGPFPGLLHCFSAGQSMADAALALGMSISFSGIVTFRNAEAVRQTARAVPDDRYLVETDAPYLAPVPKRGKTNEPAFVAHTARFLAEQRDTTPEDLARATTDNFFRLFKKARRPAAG